MKKDIIYLKGDATTPNIQGIKIFAMILVHGGKGLY